MKNPLADKIRPECLDDIVGQKHLLGKGKALRNIIENNDDIPNMIFYGPSGSGKSTLASYIAKRTKKTLRKLNGTTASTSDIKQLVAELDTIEGINGILLYLDEIQYFNKKQQQTLLEYLENGSITLIASTTENPYFYIYNAVLSRCTVFEFKPVSKEEAAKAVRRGFELFSKELGEAIEADDTVIDYISTACSGDVRKAINAVELCTIAAVPEKSSDGTFIRKVSLESAAQLTQHSSMRYDKDGDQHYDLLSAFQKSIRGSDPDAGIHYLARLLEGGDLASAIRRLLVIAAEDVGLAYPTAISVVKSCTDAALQLGLPEAQIPLAHAVILMASCPKSNRANEALNAALSDIHSRKIDDVPAHLMDSHYSGASKLGRGQGYKYPHSYGGYVTQQYLPDDLYKEGVRYYEPSSNGSESAFKKYLEELREIDRKNGK